MRSSEHNLIWSLVALPFVLLTAPLLAELLLLSFAALWPRRSRKLAASIPPPWRLILLVPSHNEQFNVVRCIESLAASAGNTGDILVIAHNCTDSTADRARATGAMVSELNDPHLPGKGNALAHGFNLAFTELRADAVMIIDADSVVCTNLVTLVREALESASVLQCRYECRANAADMRSRLRSLAFFCMNVVRPMGRARLHLSSGIFGNGFAFRREVLEQVPYAAHSIVEDLEFHLSLITAGIRCEFLERARLWAEAAPAGSGTVTQTARWEGGRMRMFRSHSRKLVQQVLSGRLSLVEPLFDLAGLPIAIEAALLCLLVLLPEHTVRLYAISGISILICHTLVGVFLGPDPTSDLRALLQSPIYVVSKIAMLPAIFKKTRARADWVRTSRTETPE
jgi:cellulose synthase/poly-beta-1,6-N-acetylglucosamine synthase-like glycosyltransferase